MKLPVFKFYIFLKNLEQLNDTGKKNLKNSH